MRPLLPFIKPHKKNIILASIFMILDCFGELLQPLIVAKIVDDGIQNQDMNIIIVYGLIMIGFSLLSFFFAVMNARCAARAGVGFATDLRKGLFEKVQTFSFKNIDTFSTASLATRMTNDLTIVQNSAIMSMRMMLKAPIMFTFSFIAALILEPKLSTVLAICIPLLIISLFIILKKAAPRFTQMQKAVDDVNSDVQENVRNVRVVKSFVRQDYEIKKFKKFNDAAMNAALKALNIVMVNMPLMTLIMNFSVVGVLFIGGNMIISNAGLEIGTLTAYINYITHILMSLMVLSMVFMSLTRASASVKRVNEVLNTKVDLTEKDNPSDATVEKGTVEFKNVSFKYNENNEEYTLSNISFSARAGQVVAIVGSTGSGKTTLVQLIPRLYDVSEGEILVDGIDVRDYKLDNLRGSIGMVLQNNTLFSGTVSENLRWGNKFATDEEVIDAAKAARVHDFVMAFPDGYDTYIEQGGVNVSGGQKQRLCIARAMLKQPKILILDDSTSAVDTATEAKIRESFYTRFKDTTVLIIAQRISSVMSADRILVVDNGTIVADGNHDKLMKTSEVYRDIYYSQMEKEDE